MDLEVGPTPTTASARARTTTMPLPPVVVAPVAVPARVATVPVPEPSVLAPSARAPAVADLVAVWRKALAGLLDGVLVVALLGVGWLAWAAVVAGSGQTPGRQVVGIRLVDSHDRRPLGWARMVVLRGVVGVTVAAATAVLTVGVVWLLPLWDRRNQTVVDKVSAAVAVPARQHAP